MDRRTFLASGTLAIGAAASSRPCVSSSLDESLQAVESAQLTLTPRTSDHWELVFKPKRPLRILQVTDTHFSSSPEKDRMSIQTLNLLIQRTDPDLIVHTGDFVNNDSKDPVEWGGVEYFNQLGKPWALCFGNHDYPVANSAGCRSLEEFRASLMNCAMGYAELEGVRSYCYRHDIRGRGDEPTASLFYFQVGYSEGDRKISDPQLAWFEAQMKADQDRGWRGPILVFVHIPLIEYDALAASGRANGFKNEKVCFDSDTGASFKVFAASKRVRGVFCGHDHVNNYFGVWQGIGLHYGRVSGWGGYGKWERGGRLISLNTGTGRFTQQEVVIA